MKKIRWIASRTIALQALAKNYPLMVTHMEHLASQNKAGSSDNYAKAVGFLSNVKQIKFIQYLYFSWTLQHS